MPCADLGIDPHLAAGLPGEAVDHRQAEAGALADRLGREERIERLRDHIRRHAGAGVGDAERDILARRQVALAARRASSSHVLAVSMVRRPPSGMASRALMHRLSSAFSSWLGSTSVGPQAAARRRPRRSIVGPDRAADQVLHAGDQPVDVGRLGIERLAAREGQQPVGQRRRALGRALARPRCSGRVVESGPARMRVCSSSRLPLMPVSRLLKSCAMPPVSWPTASIFCDWRSASSACLRSAMLPRRALPASR